MVVRSCGMIFLDVLGVPNSGATLRSLTLKSFCVVLIPGRVCNVLVRVF